MTGLRTRLLEAWDARPTLVRAGYIIELESEVKLAGGTLPTRARRFRRLIDWWWAHRPVLTTNQRLSEMTTAAVLVAMKRAELPAPTPPCPHHGTRTTSTGRSLVSV